MSGELPEPREPQQPFAAPRDYDDEVGSQRRVRWMTQVMVMPALVGWLFGFSYLFGYFVGSFGRDEFSDLPRTGFAAVLIALPAYFVIRGKIGSRRRWLNYALLALCVAAGAWRGWLAGLLVR